MKVRALVVILAAAVSCGAQTAKVEALTPEDTAKIKALYAERDAVSDKIANFETHVVESYLSTNPPNGGDLDWRTAGIEIAITGTDGKSETVYIKHGWEYGKFEYTSDFRFIVPKPPTTSNGLFQYGTGCSIPGGVYASPASLTAVN